MRIIPPNNKYTHPNDHQRENGIDHKTRYHNHIPIAKEMARLYIDLAKDSKNLYEI